MQSRVKRVIIIPRFLGRILGGECSMAERISEKYIGEFFGLLPDEAGKAELAEIKSKLKKIVYEHGHDIVTIDEDPDGMYFIESGTAVVLGREGEQLNILHIGQYFGEYGVLSGQKRLSTVRSLGRSVVYKMESEDLLGFLRRHPDIYGEFMKRVYGQLSSKHSQILALSGMHKGVLTHPSNSVPLSHKQIILNYGTLLLIYILTSLFIPVDSSLPVFALPLVFMLAYVLITKRTVESLIASGIYAAILVYRSGMFVGYADALIETMGSADNVFTVLVMALMGAMVNLIVHSGGVTAFEKTAAKTGKTPKGIFLSSLAIMTATSIDDGLNMTCASYASYTPAKEKGIVREKLALFYSMLPTVLSSFFPLSLWGIFVIGTISATEKKDALSLFCHSIPFNFFSIITVVAMFLFAIGKLPNNRQIKDAEKRYKETGILWPTGSEKYLSTHDTEVWGKIVNVMLPIIVLAASSLAIRSLRTGSFVVDSAVGLLTALAFMFLLYCFRGIMSPEQFIDNLVEGISGSTLPIIMYLLTMCFSSLLDVLGLHIYVEEIIDVFDHAVFLLPAATFVLSMLLTMALGSSWAMYAITFPIILNLVHSLGLNPFLFVGAIAGAGIAGEKNCAFTAEALNVGTAVGINPAAARKIRMAYSSVFSAIAAAGYLIAGLFL